MGDMKRGAADAPPEEAVTPPVAFITGSHAYGTPTCNSDVDLVIRCSFLTRQALTALMVDGANVDEDYGVGVRQISVGRLNLIMCSSDRVFAAWAEGTRRLRLRTPVSREDAVSVLKALGVADPDETKPDSTPPSPQPPEEA